MESLHLSVTRAVNEGIFKGLCITGSSSLSHLFYADDAVFIEEWSIENLDNLLKILNCFHLASGLCINVNKSHVLGVGVPSDIVRQGALCIGCEVMQTPFKYLRVMVGDHMSRYSAWSNTIQKDRGRLSRWKVKTLSIGGRLTLLKSVLGAVLVYNMSLYKASKCVLHELERLRNNFFKGGDSQDSKITWVAWEKVLSFKKNRGLGVSSFFALNRALLLKWKACTFVISMATVHIGLKIYRSELDDLFLPSSAVANRWESVVGGTFNGRRSRLSLIGLLGSVLFVCRLSLKPCWRVFSTLLGGMSGPFGIG
nr:RNA-directed DNA polymerase, eukaryota [Tanacetum cinerariifolium]